MAFGARDIHRLFSRKGPKFYKGDALNSWWERLSPTERLWHWCAAILVSAAAILLTCR